MPNSPPILSHVEIKQDHDHDHGQSETAGNHSRLCDFCSSATAILYCRADTAKLCLACDRQVHSTNQLFTKHTRSLLCDSCNSAPATIFCSTDSCVLCQNCDWERHNLALSAAHDRRPVEGFIGCPAVTELLSIWGFEDVSKKSLMGGDGLAGSGSVGSDDGISDYFVWDTPSVVSLDDLIVSSGSEHNYSAMGVPPLPKNRNAACGEHKDELLRQLREMAKLEPNVDDGEDKIQPLGEYQSVPQHNFQFQDECFGFQHNSEPSVYSSHEASSFQWCNEIADQETPTTGQLERYIETTSNCIVPDKDSDINNLQEGQSQHHPITESVHVYPRELNTQERDTAICRYKEKKKSRRYDKHIRYESRKVRAESRTRIRGRFAKIDR